MAEPISTKEKMKRDLNKRGPLIVGIIGVILIIWSLVQFFLKEGGEEILIGLILGFGFSLTSMLWQMNTTLRNDVRENRDILRESRDMLGEVISILREIRDRLR